jgi:transcriptional regulator with XRE-family HTH domain
MTANEQIRKRRLELRLEASALAGLAGISLASYRDIESYPDEIYTLVPLTVIKKLFAALNLDLLGTLGIVCRFCGENLAHIESSAVPRNELIRRARLRLGLSKADLANRSGLSEFEEELEADPEHLESWRFSMIVELADALQVPVQLLLGVKCSNCGN